MAEEVDVVTEDSAAEAPRRVPEFEVETEDPLQKQIRSKGEKFRLALQWVMKPTVPWISVALLLVLLPFVKLWVLYVAIGGAVFLTCAVLWLWLHPMKFRKALRLCLPLLPFELYCTLQFCGTHGWNGIAITAALLCIILLPYAFIINQRFESQRPQDAAVLPSFRKRKTRHLVCGLTVALSLVLLFPTTMGTQELFLTAESPFAPEAIPVSGQEASGEPQTPVFSLDDALPQIARLDANYWGVATKEEKSQILQALLDAECSYLFLPERTISGKDLPHHKKYPIKKALRSGPGDLELRIKAVCSAAHLYAMARQDPSQEPDALAAEHYAVGRFEFWSSLIAEQWTTEGALNREGGPSVSGQRLR